MKNINLHTRSMRRPRQCSFEPRRLLQRTRARQGDGVRVSRLLLIDAANDTSGAWRPAGWRAVTSPAARQPWRASPKFPIRVARVTWSAPRIFGFHYETGMSRLFRTYRAPLSQGAISERKFPTGTGIVGARKIHHLGALA